MTELEPLAFTVAGQPVAVAEPSLTDNAGGFDQMRGRAAATDWARIDADQGAEVIAYSGSVPVWAGRLSTRPLIDASGWAALAAQGHKHAARKYERRLFLQQHGLEGWVTTDSDPHVNDDGTTVYGATADLEVHANPTRAVYVTPKNDQQTAGRSHGIIFYAEGVELGRLTFTMNYGAAAETANLKLQPRVANGPIGTATDIGSGYQTGSGNRDSTKDVDFTDTPGDLVILALHVNTTFTPTARYTYRVTRVRINSVDAPTDTFEGSQVIGLIADRLGYDGAGIVPGEANVLPFDWRSGDWLAAGLYVAALEDRYLRIGARTEVGPLCEYAPWGTRRWTTSQAAGAVLDLVALERFDAVRVRYTGPSGARRSALATSADYPTLGNTFELELNDKQHDGSVAGAVASRLMGPLSQQTYAGTVAVPAATDGTGAGDVRQIRYGDELVITDFAPGVALTSRVLEVEHSHGVPVVRVGRVNDPSGLQATWAHRGIISA